MQVGRKAGKDRIKGPSGYFGFDNITLLLIIFFLLSYIHMILPLYLQSNIMI